jgi:ribose transport system substrate-binding protein
VNAVREMAAEGVTIIGYDTGRAQTDTICEGLTAGAITQNPVGIG